MNSTISKSGFKKSLFFGGLAIVGLMAANSTTLYNLSYERVFGEAPGYSALVDVKTSEVPLQPYTGLWREDPQKPEGIYPYNRGGVAEGIQKHELTSNIYTSPNQRYYFVISYVRLTHKPKDFVLTHTLMQRKGEAIKTVWNRSMSDVLLPRPRMGGEITVINNQGHVLRTDANHNYSDYTDPKFSSTHRHTQAQAALYRIGDKPLIILYGKDGSIIKTYNFKTLAEALNTTPVDLIQSATEGYWRQSQPVFDENQENIIVESYGKTLSINLETGELSTL